MAYSGNQLLNFPIYLPLAISRYHSTPEVIILPSSNHYRTSWGSLHVLGEIENDSGSTIYNVWVTARLFDRNDNLLRTSSALLMADYLAPDGQTCFDIVFESPPSSWYRYEFEPVRYETGTSGPRLSVESTDGYPDTDAGGDDIYLVDGRVRNISGSRVHGVKAVATLYNSRDKVVSCSSDYIDTTDLALNNNAAAAFEIIFWDRQLYDDVSDYRVQASCCPY